MDRGLPDDHFDLTPDAVRARFQWAVRHGKPLWVWPDTSVAAWREALIGIERATRLVLSGNRQASLEGRPEDVGIAAYTSGMGPLLGFWATQGWLEAEPLVAAVLELHYSHNRARMERLSRHAIVAVDAVADRGVPVTVLKGMHTAHAHFSVPAARPLADIDLLIDADDQPAAARVLRSLGYAPERAVEGEQAWRLAGTAAGPRTLSLVHRDDPWHLDLHTSLNRRYSPGAAPIDLDRALQGCALQPWPLSAKGHVLPPAELALHLACHAGMGFSNLTLLRLTELVFVIRHAAGKSAAFWEGFVALAGRTGTAANVFPALHFAAGLAPGTVPGPVLEIIARAAPAGVRRIVSRLSPATCQRVERCSMAERFMWTRTVRGWLREIRHEALPAVGPRQWLEIYRNRFWRFARGTITR